MTAYRLVSEQTQNSIHATSDDSVSCDECDEIVDSGGPYEIFISSNDIQVSVVNEMPGVARSSQVLMNFVVMSVLFSANHGAMVSCLAFTTLQLGSTGAWELSLLHLVYAASALLGSTFVVKQMGSRNSITFGMALYSTYVFCFWSSIQWPFWKQELAAVGAITGGVGGAILWTAQGSYFCIAAKDYADTGNDRDFEEATSFLAGIFAFIYLVGEVMCKLLSWAILETENSTWNKVTGIYIALAISSTVMMAWVFDYPNDATVRNCSVTYKLTAALQLLIRNPKMKYMIGLNAVFGLAYPFVNSFVNGEVVHRVLANDENLHNVGLFSAMSAAVAAICSLVFGCLTQHKGAVLIFGAFSFGMVTIPFLIQPNFGMWGERKLALVYFFQGVGRSTFEGALRAVFAEYFPDEREGAFANIILQNGVFTAVGFVLSYYVPCWTKDSFCLEFKEGGLHNILVLEVSVVVTAVVAIMGYSRASILVAVDNSGEHQSRLEPLLNNERGDAEIENLGIMDCPS